MIFVLVAAAVASEVEAYVVRVVPKVLWFEGFKGEVLVDALGEEDGDVTTVNAAIGERRVRCLVERVGEEWDVVYAEADNRDGWVYRRATAEEDEVGIGYMRKMVNSIVPPSLVRSTAHRVREVDENIHHQMTLIMEVYGRRSLQFLEWKDVKGDSCDHAFVDHHVIAREGETI